MQPHLLTNFETQNCCQKKLRFNGVYSRNNLLKIKDRTYVINLDEYESVVAHWVACMRMVIMWHVLITLELNIFRKKLEKIIDNRNIETSVFRVQAYDSIMCGYFCIGFTYFMLRGKRLLNYNNIFSSKSYERNDKTILKYLQ